MSRPKVNLAKADTGAITHNLFVRVYDPKSETGPEVARGRQGTLAILKFLAKVAPTVHKMGVNIAVFRITTKYLANPKLKAALKESKINMLPALRTPNNLYLGVSKIKEMYELNIREFVAVKRREEKVPAGSVSEDVPENDYDRMVREEMTAERAENDAQEAGLGEDGDRDMMSSFNQMVQRREESAALRRKSQRPGTLKSGEVKTQPKPQQPAAGGRGDNLDDGDDISGLISTITRGGGGGDAEKVFSGGGGDSLEDDGTGAADPQDAWMERSYWENQEKSDS